MPDHLRAADGWRVESAALDVSRHLVMTFHYSRSTSNTATYCHGLFAPTGMQVGAALWMPPTRGAGEAVAGQGWRGVLMLSRLVVTPGVPTNGASFLLGRSMALIDRRRWPVLLTYADGRVGHTGAIYRATNWRDDGSVAAGDVWTHGESGIQRGRKRGGRTLTSDEMRELGFIRQPSIPKRRFVHVTRADAIGSGPIEELNAELRDLGAKVRAALVAE